MNDFAVEKDAPSFTFRAVQIFVAAVEAASVTQAAHRLGISPSSVSQQLANLEAALGARLLVRTARSFRLTEAGALFLERAKTLLDDVGAAKAELALADQMPPMTLRVASIEELDTAVTASWIGRMTEAYPNLAFSLSCRASHENKDDLGSRSVDLMIAVDSVGDADWIERHMLLRDPYILVRAHGLPPVAGIDALMESPFIRYASALRIGRDIEAQLRRTSLHPPKKFEFTTNPALFAMVDAEQGFAITTALSFLCTPLAHTQVEAQALPIPGFSRKLALHGRRGALGDLPRRVAVEIRSDLERLVIAGAPERLPFIGSDLALLQ